MLLHKLISLFCCCALSTYVSAQSYESPGLGVPISEEDLTLWDISIETDGSGLPIGFGTVEQGEKLYELQCLSCHGVEGGGKPYDRLVGGHGSLAELQQVRTLGSFWPYVSTVYDYIRRAMPFNSPQSLSDDEVYAVTAYLLYLNGIIDKDTVLSAETMTDIEMPNIDGFIMSYP